MSKHKNFLMERHASATLKEAKVIKIGDVFEREGSLHMRVNLCEGVESEDRITICNLNTGSVWTVDPNVQKIKRVRQCTMSYGVD